MIEVLVVIGVIALLLALLVPAVQYAREAARRMRCGSRLRELGIAVHAYASDYTCLPPGTIIGEHGFGNNWSQLVQLLPYLDESTFYDRINFKVSAYDPDNSTILTTRVSLMLCPSLPEGRMKPSAPQPAVYPGNLGSGRKSEVFDGLFTYTGAAGMDAFITFSDITDGAARTAMFSEWIPTASIGVTDFERGRGFLILLPSSYSDRERFVKDCLKVPLNPSVNQGSIGRSWLDGFETRYNHQLTPNMRSCHARGFSAFTVSSYHPGGVNTVFADAHVEWISDSIDREVWRAMGSRNGGETF